MTRQTDQIAPTNNDINRHLARQAARCPQLIRVSRIGTSNGGRPIMMARLSDAAVEDCDKQHAFIGAGRHGNEESGRAQALALIDWLLSRAGRKILKQQIVTVIPCANPDGCASDSYKNSDGIDPWTDIEAATIAAEGRSFLRALKNNPPDLFIDLHAKGHCGHAFDMVLHPQQRVYTEDFYLIWQMMQEMAEAGEAATRIPHEIHSMEWPGWNGRGPTVMMYEQFKSMALLTETSESNECSLPLALRARVGLERIKAALAWGQQRYPKLPYSGYPNQLVAASFNLGIVAIGRNARQRRNNRIRIWQERDHFTRLRNQIPEQELRKVCQLVYSGPPLYRACGVQIQIRGHHQLSDLRLNGRPVNRSASSLFKQWHSDRATWILVPVSNLHSGNYEIVAEFV